MLALLVTAYGVAGAGAGLLQVRRLLEVRGSCDVSALFFAVYTGGYVIWLAYGVSIGSLPLVIVDAIGVATATLTLAITLALRGSLLNPVTWRSCPSSGRPSRVPDYTSHSEIACKPSPSPSTQASPAARHPQAYDPSRVNPVELMWL